MTDLKFQHKVIDPKPLGCCNDVCLIADVDGDGQKDIIIGGKFDLECNPGTGKLVWYRYPDWTRYHIGTAEMEAGGVVHDITRNGKPDIIIGEQGRGKNLFWWENPENPEKPWKQRLITDRFQKYHDQAIGDVDGDGKDELVVLSQGTRILCYFDIPEDPTVEPWPEANCHIIAEDIEVEGARVADIDGDGVNEIVAGDNIFKHEGDLTKPWKQRKLLPDFNLSRCAIADLNGNGHLDIVLAEGETHVARVVWLEGPDFKTVHTLRNDLFNPHSLEVADFTGNGSMDIFCGEMHLDKNQAPKLVLFLNDGKGSFEEMIIDCPQGTHEAKIGYFGGSKRPTIVGKPYAPNNQVDIWEIVE
ncbi:MAG: FG-GAP repeat domain-containing protein [Candidatus Sumerlaeia bacterium]